jgi:hypothetical protein
LSAYTDPPITLLSNPHAPSSLPRAIATQLKVISTIFYLAILGPYLDFQNHQILHAWSAIKGMELGDVIIHEGIGTVGEGHVSVWAAEA